MRKTKREMLGFFVAFIIPLVAVAVIIGLKAGWKMGLSVFGVSSFVIGCACLGEHLLFD